MGSYAAFLTIFVLLAPAWAGELKSKSESTSRHASFLLDESNVLRSAAGLTEIPTEELGRLSLDSSDTAEALRLHAAEAVLARPADELRSPELRQARMMAQSIISDTPLERREALRRTVERAGLAELKGAPSVVEPARMREVLDRFFDAKGERVLYFAYGSNLDPVQMRERCPGAGEICATTLEGYDFAINADGWATVRSKPGARVRGVLWGLTKRDEASLDLHEEVPEGIYRKEQLKVGGVNALVYRTNRETPGVPREGYLELIVDWAKRRGFDAGYVARLESWFHPDAAAARFKDGVDYDKELANVVSVEIETRLSDLPQDQRDVIQELLKLGPIADRIYRRQKSGALTEELLDALGRSSDPRATAAQELLDLHAGPYIKARGNEAIFDVSSYSSNGIGYATDVSKVELEKFIAAHASEKEKLLSPYTIVERRSDGTFDARYLHELFPDEVREISHILRSAAAKAEHPGLKAFLQAKAEDVLIDDYERSSKAWIDMKDSPIDLVIGPTNTNEDLLFRKKGSYTFALYLRDPKGDEIMNLYRRMIPEIGRRLPVTPEHNPYLKIPDYNPASAMMALRLVAVGGETKVFTPVGWALPIEPWIVTKYGKKMFLVTNVAATRDVAPIDGIHRRLFGRPYEPERFFWITTGHEQAHGMLPRTVGLMPGGTPLNDVLHELGDAIEETKVDLISMGSAAMLREKREIDDERLWSIAEAWIANRIAFQLYKDPNDDYAKFALVSYNILKSKSAFTVDERGRLTLDHQRFPSAVWETAGLLLDIQAKGDRAAAERLLAEFNYPAPELDRAFAQLRAANVPAATRYRAKIVP